MSDPPRRRPAMRLRSSRSPRTVGREEGRWILGTGPWRPAGDERKYLRSVERHPDAAVFVAEVNGSVVARLSLSRDPHPASRHVADLGLMVAVSQRRRGVGTALLDEAVALGAVGGRQQARAARLSLERAGARPVRVVRVRARGLPQGALRAWRRARRRDPDGVRRPDGSLAPRRGRHEREQHLVGEPAPQSPRASTEQPQEERVPEPQHCSRP